MTFHDLIRTVEDAASTAVHVAMPTWTLYAVVEELGRVEDEGERVAGWVASYHRSIGLYRYA